MSLRHSTMLQTFINPGRQVEGDDARAWKGKID
jgi:hypothetical protein